MKTYRELLEKTERLKWEVLPPPSEQYMQLKGTFEVLRWKHWYGPDANDRLVLELERYTQWNSKKRQEDIFHRVSLSSVIRDYFSEVFTDGKKADKYVKAIMAGKKGSFKNNWFKLIVPFGNQLDAGTHKIDNVNDLIKGLTAVKK